MKSHKNYETRFTHQGTSKIILKEEQKWGNSKKLTGYLMLDTMISVT